MNQKIIVDTSVWIEYFKNRLNDAEIIEKGMYQGVVYMVGPIVSELLQGVKTENEYLALSGCIGAVSFMECKYCDWVKTGEIANNLRKKGLTIPLTDIIIASVAIRNNTKVYTFDHHFKQIPGIDLY